MHKRKKKKMQTANAADAVIAELEQARAAISRAERTLESEGEFDVKEIEAQVDLAAAATTALDGPPDPAMRDALINLVTDLNLFHKRLRETHAKTAAMIGRTATSRRAVVAYGRR